jgi:Fe-S cluster assembly protein SufD
MSRGLSRVQAKQLIIDGFLLEVVEQITDSEIKKFVEKQII